MKSHQVRFCNSLIQLMASKMLTVAQVQMRSDSYANASKNEAFTAKTLAEMKLVESAKKSKAYMRYQWELHEAAERAIELFKER